MNYTRYTGCGAWRTAESWRFCAATQAEASGGRPWRATASRPPAQMRPSSCGPWRSPAIGSPSMAVPQRMLCLRRPCIQSAAAAVPSGERGGTSLMMPRKLMACSPWSSARGPVATAMPQWMQAVRRWRRLPSFGCILIIKPQGASACRLPKHAVHRRCGRPACCTPLLLAFCICSWCYLCNLYPMPCSI